ncbi:MAG: hypothetical protein JSS27_08325 [Planctomycetes bacterium]|nr:hypothetical protein [Planctomycetota bacterium]
MTIPKHKRRTIVVDGTQYHWTPGRHPQGWIVIQHGSGKGPYVKIDLFATPATEAIFPFMNPAEVEAAIRFALSEGWNPSGNGKNLWLDFQQFALPQDRFSIHAE